MNDKQRGFTAFITLIIALVFSMTVSTLAQEHPEHPKESSKKKIGMKKVSIKTMADAISGYIKSETKLKGGYFTLYDASAKEPLALTLVKVHKDKLAQVDKGLYFACTDFKATNGKLYDVDFFMKDGRSGLEVSDVMIHKVDGNPRYTWVEENGMWKRK